MVRDARKSALLTMREQPTRKNPPPDLSGGGLFYEDERGACYGTRSTSSVELPPFADLTTTW
jgi:hypothetical protein